MYTAQMPRKDTKLRLDDRILLALREKASEDGMSFNALCESILFSFAKGSGKLPIDAEPLKEGHGGKRKGAGKKRSPNDPLDVENHSSKDDCGSSEARSVADADAIGEEEQS